MLGQNKNKWIPLALNEYDKNLNQLDDIMVEKSRQTVNEKTITDYFYKAYSCFLGYTFKDRYNITLNLRNDVVGFYHNGEKQELTELYPSVSAGLIFSKENYLNSEILSYGKLRCGWGKAGNSQAINYSFFAKIMRDMEYIYAFENANHVTRSATIRQTVELYYLENMNDFIGPNIACHVQ